MTTIKGSQLSFVLDGKNIDIQTPDVRHSEMNEDLLDETKFQEFLSDPAVFASNYGLVIDTDISDQLREKLSTFKTLPDLQDFIQNGVNERGATAWAIAAGSYSISSSKIAVAF